MTNFVIKLCLLSFFLSSSTLYVLPQSEKDSSWLYYWQKALDEYKTKNYPAFLENAEKTAEIGPSGHPGLIYLVARAYSLNGRKIEAAKGLRDLAEMGIGVDAYENEDFVLLRGSTEWSDVIKEIAAVRKPLVRSKAEFTIPEPDLGPEGIAYDPKHRVFYLGSVKGKIVRLDGDGRHRDFKASGEDGLEIVLGMKVDARRRLLWVCNNAKDGVGLVHKYNVDSGKLLKIYKLGNKPHHLLNDITFNRRGDAYVTDSLESAVYEIRADTEEIRLLVKLEHDLYPNGIDLSKDEKRLFVATFAGISLIHIGTKTHTDLQHDRSVALTGADGLYLYKNSLIAVQNSNPSPDRVVRLFFNAAGNKVEKARVIESNHPLYAIPTTGVIVGNKFFYVANSHLDSFGVDGKISSAAKLRNPLLLKVSLYQAKNRYQTRRSTAPSSRHGSDR